MCVRKGLAGVCDDESQRRGSVVPPVSSALPRTAGELRLAEERNMASNMKLAGLTSGGKKERKAAAEVLPMYGR